MWNPLGWIIFTPLLWGTLLDTNGRITMTYMWGDGVTNEPPYGGCWT